MGCLCKVSGDFQLFNLQRSGFFLLGLARVSPRWATQLFLALLRESHLPPATPASPTMQNQLSYELNSNYRLYSLRKQHFWLKLGTFDAEKCFNVAHIRIACKQPLCQRQVSRHVCHMHHQNEVRPG